VLRWLVSLAPLATSSDRGHGQRCKQAAARRRGAVCARRSAPRAYVGR